MNRESVSIAEACKLLSVSRWTFAAFRHHGEWFKLSPLQIEAVFHGRDNAITA